MYPCVFCGFKGAPPCRNTGLHCGGRARLSWDPACDVLAATCRAAASTSGCEKLGLKFVSWYTILQLSSQLPSSADSKALALVATQGFCTWHCGGRARLSWDPACDVLAATCRAAASTSGCEKLGLKFVSWYTILQLSSQLPSSAASTAPALVETLCRTNFRGIQ